MNFERMRYSSASGAGTQRGQDGMLSRNKECVQRLTRKARGSQVRMLHPEECFILANQDGDFRRGISGPGQAASLLAPPLQMLARLFFGMVLGKQIDRWFQPQIVHA